LLVGIARQVAHWCNGYGNIRQQTRPARFCRALAWSIDLRTGDTPERTIRCADSRDQIAIFRREPRRIVLPGSARTRDLICQRLRLDVRCDAQFALRVSAQLLYWRSASARRPACA
jgi:hypothetical protein